MLYRLLIGELLKQTPKATGGQSYQRGQKSTGTVLVPVETLADMGIEVRSFQSGTT